MRKPRKKSPKLVLILGICGFIAGVILVFGENYMIGIFGGIASASVAYKAYQDSKALKAKDDQVG
jgi:hypothetical protein